MGTVNLIYDYFPELTEEQRERFARLEGLYREWNEKINVISRKDMDEFWVHHVLHSLAIAKIIRFAPGTRVMDVGTGGGFPGKKIKVVEGIRDALGLQHVRTEQIRVENVAEQQDFIVSRAVTAFPAFVKLIRGKIRKDSAHSLDNGVIYLKGGDFEEEIAPFRSKVKIYSIPDFFSEDFFETKKIIYLKN